MSQEITSIRARAHIQREYKGIKGVLSITAIKALERYLDETGS